MESSLKLTILAVTLIFGGLIAALTVGLVGIQSGPVEIIDIAELTTTQATDTDNGDITTTFAPETTETTTEFVTESPDTESPETETPEPETETPEPETETPEPETETPEPETETPEPETETPEPETETPEPETETPEPETETPEPETETPEPESAFAPGLKIRFDISGDLGSSFFIDIPRDLDSAVASGWTQVQRSADAFLPSLQMYCRDGDFTLCPLYDDANWISGLQINILVEDLANPPHLPTTTGWQLWSAEAADGTTRDYWVNQQFFVSQETLNLSVEERNQLREGGATLAEGAVWVPTADGNLMRISSYVPDITVETLYTEQACIMLMGGHHYYNMTTSLDCSAEGAVYPWFTLYKNDDLIGMGLMGFGDYPEVAEGRTLWFERPARVEVQMIVPYAPECLYDLAESGLITMHIYYITEPWTITC